jgi:hypothetical protein
MAGLAQGPHLNPKVEQAMKIAVKAGALLATVVMSIGLLGSPASALDTSWGCPGCVKAPSHKPFIP